MEVPGIGITPDWLYSAAMDDAAGAVTISGQRTAGAGGEASVLAGRSTVSTGGALVLTSGEGTATSSGAL